MNRRAFLSGVLAAPTAGALVLRGSAHEIASFDPVEGQVVQLYRPEDVKTYGGESMSFGAIPNTVHGPDGTLIGFVHSWEVRANYGELVEASIRLFIAGPGGRPHMAR